MPITLKTRTMAVIAGSLLAGGLVWAQNPTPKDSASAGAQAARASSAKVPLEIGDKLKISFFETVDLTANHAGAGPQGALRTFYQRMDLSGEYTVQQDGAISIPILGRLQIAQHDLEDVRTMVAASFTAAIGRSTNVDVKIVDRPPVYVVGPVKNPGAYKYVPGMIVLHAIALAGGLDRGGGNLAGMIEGARESERVRSTSLRLNQLLAHRARLEAERNGNSTLPVPVQLTASADGNAARTLVTTEQLILHAEQAKHRQQGSEIAQKVAAARAEVVARKRKLDQVGVQAELRNERLNDMQKLKDRGFTTSNTVLTLRTELADIEARRQDDAMALTQAEAHLAQVEGDDKRLSLDHSTTLVTQIAAIDQEIATAEQTITSAKALAAALYRPVGGPDAYEIVRQTKDGAKTFRATETSRLIPGDVLKVKPASSDDTAPSSPSPAGVPAELTTPYTRAAAD